MFDIAGAKSTSRKIEAAQSRKKLEAQTEAYAEYRAEARACGYEVESFAEFIGESNRVDDRIFEMQVDSSYCNHAYLDA